MYKIRGSSITAGWRAGSTAAHTDKKRQFSYSMHLGRATTSRQATRTASSLKAFEGSPQEYRFGLGIRRGYHQKLKKTLFLLPDGSFSFQYAHDDVGDTWVMEHASTTVARARLTKELDARIRAYKKSQAS